MMAQLRASHLKHGLTKKKPGDVLGPARTAILQIEAGPASWIYSLASHPLASTSFTIESAHCARDVFDSSVFLDHTCASCDLCCS